MQHLKVVKDMLKNGVSVTKERKHKHGKGKAKTITTTEKFEFPKAGYIFKARKKATNKHLHYHAVYDHIRKQAPKFLQHLRTKGRKWVPEIAKLRPHSGRATLITELMGEGLTTALSMKYARHAPGSHKVHLKYGRLTLTDVKNACDATSSSTPPKSPKPWATMTLAELRRCEKDIAKEIEARRARKPKDQK